MAEGVVICIKEWRQAWWRTVDVMPTSLHDLEKPRWKGKALAEATTLVLDGKRLTTSRGEDGDTQSKGCV